MSWDADSVRRSIRRYVTEALPEPWRIRTERREVRDANRPIAVVQLGDQTVTRARETLHQGEVETLFPVTVTAYPEIKKEIAEGSLLAEQTRSRLLSLILHGAEVLDSAGRAWSGPYRIPLYDYEGVPVIGANRAGPPDPHDVMWVSEGSPVARTLQDPDDSRRWTVVLEMRVTVEGPGRIEDPDALLVTSMPGTWVGEP